MMSIPVFYATTDGHTQLVAEAIAATRREQGFESEATRLTSTMRHPDWSSAVSAVIGGSLHGGRHQREVGAFIARERDALDTLPAAFFSVSLSAASRNPDEVTAASALATKFVLDLEWRPRRLACFAGKLAYTRYGFVRRWLMRRIAAAEGGPTDTSRDHVLTDWQAVKAFALAIAADAAGRRVWARAS